MQEPARLVRVVFCIEKVCYDSTTQQVAILGSPECLGGWNVEKAQLASFMGTNNWILEEGFPPNTCIEFQLLLLQTKKKDLMFEGLDVTHSSGHHVIDRERNFVRQLQLAEFNMRVHIAFNNEALNVTVARSYLTPNGLPVRSCGRIGREIGMHEPKPLGWEYNENDADTNPDEFNRVDVSVVDSKVFTVVRESVQEQNRREHVRRRQREAIKWTKAHERQRQEDEDDERERERHKATKSYARLRGTRARLSADRKRRHTLRDQNTLAKIQKFNKSAQSKSCHGLRATDSGYPALVPLLSSSLMAGVNTRPPPDPDLSWLQSTSDSALSPNKDAISEKENSHHQSSELRAGCQTSTDLKRLAYFLKCASDARKGIVQNKVLDTVTCESCGSSYTHLLPLKKIPAPPPNPVYDGDPDDYNKTRAAASAQKKRPMSKLVITTFEGEIDVDSDSQHLLRHTATYTSLTSVDGSSVVDEALIGFSVDSFDVDSLSYADVAMRPPRLMSQLSANKTSSFEIKPDDCTDDALALIKGRSAMSLLQGRDVDGVYCFNDILGKCTFDDDDDDDDDDVTKDTSSSTNFDTIPKSRSLLYNVYSDVDIRRVNVNELAIPEIKESDTSSTSDDGNFVSINEWLPSVKFSLDDLCSYSFVYKEEETCEVKAFDIEEKNSTAKEYIITYLDNCPITVQGKLYDLLDIVKGEELIYNMYRLNDGLDGNVNSLADKRGLHADSARHNVKVLGREDNSNSWRIGTGTEDNSNSWRIGTGTAVAVTVGAVAVAVFIMRRHGGLIKRPLGQFFSNFCFLLDEDMSHFVTIP